MELVLAEMDVEQTAALQSALAMSDLDEQALAMFYVQNVIKGYSELEVSPQNLPLLAAVDRAEAWRVDYDDDDRQYYYNWRTGVKVWVPPKIVGQVQVRRDRLREKYTDDQLWRALQTDLGICTECGFASKGSVPGGGAEAYDPCTCTELHSRVSMLKF